MRSRRLPIQRGFLCVALFVTALLSCHTYITARNGDDVNIEVIAATKEVPQPVAHPFPIAPKASDFPKTDERIAVSIRPAVVLRDAARVIADPFAPLAVELPPPPKPVAPPPPVVQEAPRAPPMPFQYLGRMEEPGISSKDKATVVYLGRGNDTFVVHAGELVEPNYRFEGIEDGNLVIQYLPLAERQQIAIGASN